MTGPLVFALLALGAWAFGVVQARRRIGLLEQQIRSLRAMASARIEYRPLGEAETAGNLDAITDEVRAAGMTVLGDLVEEADGTRVGAMRWFVDAEGTTFGWMSRLATHDVVVLTLLSHRRDGFNVTVRTPANVALATPPFVHREVVAMTKSFAQALAAHRTFTTGELVKVHSLDELRTELAGKRALVQAWREQQDPADLLEQDLHGILGAHYGKLGKAMLRRLRGKPPAATVVST